MASVTTRLISSGMARSRLRSPASTCTRGMPSFAATRPQATVLLTSPTTTTASGRRSSATASNAVMMAAVCAAWLPGPTAKLNVRIGNAEVAEEPAAHRRVVVLAGVDEQRLDRRRAAVRGEQGRDLDEVGPRSDDVRDAQPAVTHARAPPAPPSVR